MGSSKTNADFSEQHWQMQASGYELQAWTLKIHRGNKGVDEVFPSTNRTLWNDLRTEAAAGKIDFLDFCDALTGAWGDTWDDITDAEVRDHIWLWFRDIAPPG